jgi:O-antigen/teichoic acid export membrane protein
MSSIQPVGYFLGSLALIWAGRLQIRNIVLLQIGLQFITLILVLVIAAEKGLLFGLSVSRKNIKGLIGYGTKVYAGEMTGNVNTRLDQMLLAGLFPPKLLGLYVVAVAASSGPGMLANAVRTVSSPRISGSVTKLQGREQLARTFGRYVRFVVPFAILLGAALPLLIPFVYGQDFKTAVLTSEILLVASVVIGAATVLGAGGQALGDPWVASRAQIAAVPVTVVLLLFLLPRFGILGAGLASLAAYTVQFIVVVFGLRKHGIQCRNLAGINTG